jgi:glycosyltransferase involved in cell wall biosynthesis
MRAGKRLALLLPDMRGGGAERVALRLVEDFAAAGHSVDLVLMQARGELLERVPAQVRVVDLKAARIRDALWPLVRYFRAEKPAAALLLMWPLTIIGILAHRLARSAARLVVNEHTTLSRHYAHLSPLKRRLMGASMRLFYPYAEGRAVVSGGVADDMAKLSGLPRDSIEVIYNPVAGPPPLGADARAAADAAWGGPGKRIVTVGNLKPEKNHLLLIRAFAQVCREQPARLMVLGEGEMRPALERLAADLGVADRVLLPGFTNNPWPYLATADLFVLSSDYEGYPLVLVEAMRAGLPVVSTDCESGPSEILDGGRYGTLVPPGEAPALASAMEATLGRPIDPDMLIKRAEALSGQSTAERYRALMLGSQ